MAWYHDFCLSCDRQTTEGIYCSQQCRLADLERSGASEPSSPSSVYSGQRAWQPVYSSSSSSSQFHLAPAVNFAAYKSTAASSSTAKSSITAYSYPHTYTTSKNNSSSTIRAAPSKRLSSSSSRSSLSSVTSGSTTSQGLTDSDYSQLRDYSNCFDQVRAWKRRATSG